MRRCLDEDEILAFRSGTLSKDALASIKMHLETCSACLEVIQYLDLSESAGGSGGVGRSMNRIPPQQIGNYLLLDELGAGGMGFVYAAYDTQLDRRIALKLMHNRGRTASGRIRREAQAMARLSHPNIVTIYGVHSLSENDLAIAMEYVEGRSLTELLASEPRMDWMAVRSIFTQAARGLAAAHDAGLVHRDFKPGNLLVTDDGQAKIIDFGLVYAEQDSSPPFSPEDVSGESEESVKLTNSGARIGTPAYMAPEQFNGEPVDGRTDQFAFCLCLYEAVYGQRAFAVDTFEDLRKRVRAGQWILPKRPDDVPRSVEDILRRGLSSAPERRFLSMRDVAAKLELATMSPPLHRRRLFWWTAAALAAAMVLAAVMLRPTAPACQPPKDAFAGIWSSKKQSEVRARILSSGQANAEDTWHRIATGLRAFVVSWLESHVAACEAARLDDERPYVHALRGACLNEQRDQFELLVKVLSETPPKSAERAVDLVAGLSVRRCDDTSGLLALPTPESPERAEAVAEVRRRLNTLEIVYLAGDHEGGLAASEDSLLKAEALGYAPVVAEAKYWQGRFLTGLQRYEQSVGLLETVYESALALNHLDLAADVSREVAEVVGLYQGEVKRALQWSRSARGLARLRDPGGVRDARSLQVLGMLQALGGQSQDAQKALIRANGLLEAYYGPKHPYLIRVASDIGIACLSGGQFHKALEYFKRALQTATALYGDKQKRLSRSHLNVGLAYYYLAREARVKAALEQGRLIAGRDNGPDTLRLLKESGRSLSRARTLLETGTQDEHEDLIGGIILAAVGSVDLLRGDRVQAQRNFLASVERLRAAVGDRHPYISWAHQGLGEVALADRRAPEAIQHLEKVLKISEAGRDSLARLAMAEFELARALWQDKQHERAWTLATSAQEHFEQQGWSIDADYVRLWLRQHQRL